MAKAQTQKQPTVAADPASKDNEAIEVAENQFSVTNVSARLINVLGKQLGPGESTILEDNKDNRATIKGVEGLNVGSAEKDDEPELSQSEKDDAEAKAKANQTSNTATGAGWGQ